MGLRFRMVLHSLAGLAIAVGWNPPAAIAQSRFEQFTKKFAQTPDQAKVVSAGFLGGQGTEFLVSGGFQPDGSIIVAGVSFGPTLTLDGKTATVLGKDRPAPEKWQPRPQLKNGKPELNKDGSAKLRNPDWNDPNATAFVAKLSSDLKTVQSAIRFPWQSASVTDVQVDEKGNIYLVGPARDGIADVSTNYKVEMTGGGDTKNADTAAVYLAKLPPTVDTVEWLRKIPGAASAPRLDVNAKGELRVVGPDIRIFDTNGKQLSQQDVPGGVSRNVAFHPTNGTYAKGGEHNWSTGREPYRDPILNIYKADGSHLHQFYDWDGPFVGLDSLRLVSDSAVRKLTYDDQGNLVFYAWSDGGNSVMYREPYDIRTYAKGFQGLGMSVYGAGVLSCAYIIKLDSKTWKVSGGTLWLAFLKDKDKPNSIKVDSLGFAGDGSVVIGGESAWGLIETGNKIGQPDPTGTYVALFNEDCTSLRFCSTMPACGNVDIGDGSAWGFARGKVNGKQMLLCVSGAKAQTDKGVAAPKVNSSRNFNGGEWDGYLLLLDLSK